MSKINLSQISPNDKILIAFSGGKDSVVLLDLLAKNFERKNLALAHIDHQIRKNSAKDAIFSQKTALKYNIKYFEKKLELNNLTSNVEAVAREKRYNALYEIAQKHNYNKIATAHTKSDNIEQFFIKLYRGTSLEGLGGISFQNNIIIRPLLNFTSEEIREYIKKHNLENIEDETNKENKYLRNKIRNEIIPKLKIEGYDLENHILNLMEQIKADNEYFNSILKDTLNSLNIFDNFVFFKTSVITALPFVLKTRFIHKILYIHFTRYSNYDKIMQIAQKIEKKQNFKIQISKNLYFYFEKNYSAFILENNNPFSITETEKIFNIIKDDIKYFKNCKIKDLFINDDIKISVKKNGERFKKYNNKIVKLKDVFSDSKLPLFLRTRWPVLKINQTPVAVLFIEKGFYYSDKN